MIRGRARLASAGQGPAGHRLARHGEARSAWMVCGAVRLRATHARQGSARQGVVWQGNTWPGEARLGPARQCSAGRGMARPGRDSPVWTDVHGWAGHGSAGTGMARLGAAWRCKAGQGMDGWAAGSHWGSRPQRPRMAWRGAAGPVKAGQGTAWPGAARPGKAWGMGRLAGTRGPSPRRPRKAWPGVARLGRVWLGGARRRRARQGTGGRATSWVRLPAAHASGLGAARRCWDGQGSCWAWPAGAWRG